MIISVFTDGEKKDKIAEFTDVKYPTSFLRGLLEESREQEKEVQFMFTVRQTQEVTTHEEVLENMRMRRADEYEVKDIVPNPYSVTDILMNTERGDV